MTSAARPSNEPEWELVTLVVCNIPVDGEEDHIYLNCERHERHARDMIDDHSLYTHYLSGCETKFTPGRSALPTELSSKTGNWSLKHVLSCSESYVTLNISCICYIRYR